MHILVDSVDNTLIKSHNMAMSFVVLGDLQEQLGRKIRQVLPTLLYVDAAGGKWKKRAQTTALSHMSMSIQWPLHKAIL